VGVVALISRTACLLKHAQQEPVLPGTHNTAYRSRGVMTPTFSSKLSVIFNYILSLRKVWYHSKCPSIRKIFDLTQNFAETWYNIVPL